MNDPELAALRAKLSEIAQTLAQAKDKGQTLNEAQTEFVVVDPILQTLGYGPLEIAKQGHNATTGAIPDYTMLPGTEDTWFLEGKSFNFALTDKEAAQAVNYAHNHGARWAVLTNGRAWHIYDAHSTLSLPEKRILQIADVFTDTNAVPKIALLSRDAMCGGGILAAQALQKLNAIVRRELETPGSNLRKSLQDTVQSETGGTVPDEAVGAALLALTSGSVPDPPVTVSVPDPLPPVPAPAPDIPNDPAPSGTWYTLEELSANAALITGHKPARIARENGITIGVKSWSGVVQIGVAFICDTYGLPPLPLPLSNKSKNYLLNTAPVRADGTPMFAFKVTTFSGQRVAVNTNLSALNAVRALLTLIDAVGAPFNCVRVELETD